MKIAQIEGFSLTPDGFDTYITDTPLRKRALASAAMFAGDFQILPEKKNWLMLLGHRGGGKTHIAKAIAYAVAKKGFSVTITTEKRIVEKLQQWNEGKAYYNAIRALHYETDLLIVDELFKDVYEGATMSGWRSREIQEIFNYRYEMKKPTVVASEMLLEGIVKTNGAIADRFYERSMSIIEFTEKENWRVRK